MNHLATARMLDLLTTLARWRFDVRCIARSAMENDDRKRYWRYIRLADSIGQVQFLVAQSMRIASGQANL